MGMVILTQGELHYLQSTLELVMEEFQGMEEHSSAEGDYVLTTGATDEVVVAHEMLDKLSQRLQKDLLEELDARQKAS